ncbi:hypothetical protein [Streptomyces mexicanus]|uniref:hypothetical protein n=1 Tax=Streptomyces mexicanus TaxID=178566 RepID=UPI00366151C3
MSSTATPIGDCSSSPRAAAWNSAWRRLSAAFPATTSQLRAPAGELRGHTRTASRTMCPAR